LYRVNPISQEYNQNFQEGQKQYNLAMKTMTEKACEWIDFDMKAFSQSLQALNKDKDQN